MFGGNYYGRGSICWDCLLGFVFGVGLSVSLVFFYDWVNLMLGWCKIVLWLYLRLECNLLSLISYKYSISLY